MFCGGILESIKRKVITKSFPEVKNFCVKSSQSTLSFLQDLAYQYQGKSTITKLSFIMKKLNNFVFHGILEYFARSLLCVNIFISDDFPTFERQKNVNIGNHVKH